MTYAPFELVQAKPLDGYYDFNVFLISYNHFKISLYFLFNSCLILAIAMSVAVESPTITKCPEHISEPHTM
jgi:hypothetical protein